MPFSATASGLNNVAGNQQISAVGIYDGFVAKSSDTDSCNSRGSKSITAVHVY